MPGFKVLLTFPARVHDAAARMTAYLPRQLGLATPRSQRRSSQRTTGLPWNLTFTDAAKKVSDCDSGRSRMPTDDRDNFRAERLHPTVTARRCQPEAAARRGSFAQPMPTIAGAVRTRRMP